VLLGWPERAGIVCDIGGNSMELARIGGQGRQARDIPAWPLPPAADRGRPEKRRAHIAACSRNCGRLQTRDERIYLVGGSWRVIARLDMERRATTR
jgi:exopolyphosphatase / guanosine-5'-triphosphate,3'-diphosphate pyrophosphatase